jgi:8-oxo-dGTP diphosphatase
MAKPAIQVVAAVIERDGKYLITQRKGTAVFPLLWEFPGGRVESGETLEQALVREVQGRIGVKVIITEKLGENLHEYHDYDVEMNLFACELPEGVDPLPRGVNAVKWITSADMDKYEFPPADQRSMTLLLDLAN